MRVKTIIVDDEQLICDEIEYLLRNEPEIDIAATFTNSLEAFEYIRQNRCDLVFLDISMPGLSGLEMAQKMAILRFPPLIVFITAHADHALEAFDTPAIGYITKPVTEAKLAKVIDKIISFYGRRSAPIAPQSNKICVLKGQKIIPINKHEISYIAVKDKEVSVHTKTDCFAVSLSMQETEQLLTEKNFLRVHRQYIVNLDCIVEIIPWFHSSYLLKMNNNDEIPVSRTHIKTLREQLGLKK